MNLFVGVLAAGIAASGYSYRFAVLKNLAGLHFSKLTLSFLYRLFSLPFLIVIFFFAGGTQTVIQQNFWLFLATNAVFNLFYGYYQIGLLKRISFANFEGFTFLEILFSMLLGKVILGESLTMHQTLGIGIVVAAMAYAAAQEIRKNGFAHMGEVIFYLFLGASAGVLNKIVVQASSPILFSIAITLVTVVVYGGASWRDLLCHFKLSNKKTIRGFFFVGISTAISILATGYALKLAPVAIVSVILSGRVFLSLLVAKKKFGEIQLRHHFAGALVAVCGVFVLFS